MPDDFKDLVAQVQKTGQVKTTDIVQTNTAQDNSQYIIESAVIHAKTSRFVCDSNLSDAAKAKKSNK